MSLKTLLFATLLMGSLFATSALSQDIGVLGGGEPPPSKPKKPPAVVKRTPPPPRNKPDRPATAKPKRRVAVTITTEPAECEVYLNDTYRGTTAARNGKLIVPDLDTSLSYTLRIYKRGLGEDVQQLDLSDDLDLNVSLKKPLDQPENGGNELAGQPKNPPVDNTAANNPDKTPVKPPEKTPDRPLDKPPVVDDKTAATSPLENKPPEVKPPETKPVETAPSPTTAIKPPSSEMVLIPAGEFTMGSNKSQIENEKPQHKIMVAAFFIDLYEVTNGEYKLFCDATGRAYPASPAWDSEYFTARPNYPVVNVSWADANAYAQWVGKRLPTEEEWEKAARGTDNRIWPWGKEFQATLANYSGKEDGYEFTAPIGSFRNGASPFGVYDMAGNVWEWTASAFKPYPGGQIGDPRFQTGDYRVIRGGGHSAPAIGLRSILFRFPSEPDKVYEATGFRCARSQ